MCKGSLLKVERPSPITPRTASFQVLHLVNMCESTLLKVERLSPITLMYNKSSSATSCWHVQGLSPQSRKIESDYPDHNEFSSAKSHWHVQGLPPQSRMTESDCPHAQRVLKYYTSLTCAEDLLKVERSSPITLGTTSLQVLYLVGMLLGVVFLTTGVN